MYIFVNISPKSYNQSVIDKLLNFIAFSVDPYKKRSGTESLDFLKVCENVCISV